MPKHNASNFIKQLWLCRKFADCRDLSKYVTCNYRIGKFCLERPYTNGKCKELAQCDFSYLVFIYVLPVLHFMRSNHVAPKPGVLAFCATPPCNLRIECHTWQAIWHCHNKWHNFIDSFLWELRFILIKFSLCQHSWSFPRPFDVLRCSASCSPGSVAAWRCRRELPLFTSDSVLSYTLQLSEAKCCWQTE